MSFREISRTHLYVYTGVLSLLNNKSTQAGRTNNENKFTFILVHIEHVLILFEEVWINYNKIFDFYLTEIECLYCLMI